MKLALCQMRMSADETGTPPHIPAHKFTVNPQTERILRIFAQDPFLSKMRSTCFRRGCFSFSPLPLCIYAWSLCIIYH